MKIRTAVAEDARRVAAVYVSSWNAGFRGLMPVRVLTDDLVVRWAAELTQPLPHRWWVAEQDAALVGVVGIGPSRDPLDPTLGEVDTIAVAPTHWRTGIGHALMDVALTHLRTDGYREAILWTLADYPQGQRFYEGMARMVGLGMKGGR